MTITAETKKQIVSLESEVGEERVAAINALSKEHNAETVQLLISLLKEETSIQFREGACGILGKLEAKEAVDVLIDCLNDPDDGVIYYAALALGDIRDTKAVKPIIRKLNRKQSDPLFRSELIIALGNIGDDLAVVPLINVLRNDEDRFVRHKAALALGKLKNKKALGPLTEIARKEMNTRLYYLAISAIDKIYQG
jgi:HEAT repeat protein